MKYIKTYESFTTYTSGHKIDDVDISDLEDMFLTLTDDNYIVVCQTYSMEYRDYGLSKTDYTSYNKDTIDIEIDIPIEIDYQIGEVKLSEIIPSLEFCSNFLKEKGFNIERIHKYKNYLNHKGHLIDEYSDLNELLENDMTYKVTIKFKRKRNIATGIGNR